MRLRLEMPIKINDQHGFDFKAYSKTRMLNGKNCYYKVFELFDNKPERTKEIVKHKDKTKHVVYCLPNRTEELEI